MFGLGVIEMSDTEKPKPNTGSSIGSVYQVQVRTRDNWPGFVLGEMVIDQKWQTLRLAPSVWPVGVPTPRYAMDNIDYGVPFHVAEAQRWILISLAEASRGTSPIETRIVEFRVSRTWTCEEIGEVKTIPQWQEDHNIWTPKPAPL